MLSLAWSQVLAKKLNLSLSFLLTGLFSTDSFTLETKTLAEEEQVKKPQPALQNSLFH